ncbi:fumarylacetoacetate hydrolase family protein [Sporolactobacillus kofuensis]|uniref:Fumarylacetoacetate hydrolase family protein n=1 Tax=Sporolactobacillus kofuensis TaxID=269672 RepID=A0ABW1WGF2_9BACL|nr:fumarylacetoacetate hydrolase family protein [Sporolactobacillus kofuensis]MCO7175109.1 fumarylacetoacetate hydrolase family protein [Sporolactobacillus kofuensis]
MKKSIQNIFCVGRNYAMHAKELNNAVPTSPLFFSKPTHSIVEATGQSVTLPGNQGAIHFEAEWVVHIGRAYSPGAKADDLIDAMALGVDFTLRDTQTILKQKGYPWLAAKGFLNSALLTPFMEFPGLKACSKTDFTLHINGREVQRGNISDMIFNPQSLLDYCGQHYGLGEGDLLFTGTPAGVGKVTSDDRLTLIWGSTVVGEATVRLN